MDNLPDEILLEIFNFLSGKVLKNLMFVCKRWHSLITQSASTMKILPLRYSLMSNSTGVFFHRYHTMYIRHILHGINFSKSIFVNGLNNSIQCLDIRYCHLSRNDLKIISNGFRNLNELTLVKVKLLKEITDQSLNVQNENELTLNRLVLLKVDHEILNLLKNVRTIELEITDCNENEINCTYLTNFIMNQNNLMFLNIGEMSNNSNVFFHKIFPVNHKFELKKFHSLFCSNHSHVPEFENNFISFLNRHSRSLENIKLSGKSLPENIYKFIVSSCKNLHTLEIVASSVPQENSFYENLQENFNLKNLVINSTITRNNFNGLVGLMRKYSNIRKLDLMDTDEFIANDLLHYISCYLVNLKEFSILNFNKSFNPSSKIKSLEKFSIKIINNIEQLLKFIVIHESTLKSLSIWWIIRDFNPKIIEEIISLRNLSHLKIGGRFIANKRIFEVVRSDYKNLRTLHLIVNNYDEVKHLKFSFPHDKNLYNGLKCIYFEEQNDREPLND